MGGHRGGDRGWLGPPDAVQLASHRSGDCSGVCADQAASMMPPALLRLLPHIGLALALLAVIWGIDHRGYKRAMGDRDARDARLLGQLHAELRDSEHRLAASMANIERDYETTRQSLSRAGAALNPIIIKEATHDPRLSDPALGLSPGLLTAVNSARAAGACTATAAGRIDCALSAPAAGGQPGNR